MISERTAVNSETKRCQNYVKPQDLQLRMIDLNLFRVFDAMMLHRSVRKASQILSVTPSAVSHALCRLRQSIGDELFNATEFGMQPTQRALELASAVREGLEKLELALTGKESVPLVPSDAAVSLPSWPSTIMRQMASPNQVPCGFVEMNALTTLSSCFGSIPGPESCTDTAI